MTVPKQMKAVVLDQFGGPEALHVRSLAVPDVRAGEVLIRVHSAGVGSWDAQERRGEYDGVFGLPSTFPYVLGWDASGTVAQLGSGVDQFSAGQQVYAATMPLPRGGCYAEYVAVPQEHVALVPEGLSLPQAAALPWDGLTALSGLQALDLEIGQTLLVFGASGGIGHLAVQLARMRGVRTLAVASGEDGRELCERLGADAVVDGRRDDVVQAARLFAPQGLDAALLTAGGTVADRAMRGLRPGARVAVPHGLSPEPVPLGGHELVHYDGVRDREATNRLSASVASGAVHVEIAATFPLDRARAAHERLATHYVGKIVLTVIERAT
jgi:NADPH:quinone reductase-like Zn-dependent oxidoreductase